MQQNVPLSNPHHFYHSLVHFQITKIRTLKVFLGVTPSGVISFVSKCYKGSISDKGLVKVSGLLKKLDAGDEIVADMGFLIQDILAPLGVCLNVPPLLRNGK